jgi:hypothetical protein
MTRRDFQRLAEERLADAVALLEKERFAAAFYIGGYAVECGLKRPSAGDWLSKKRFQRGVWSTITPTIWISF